MLRGQKGNSFLVRTAFDFILYCSTNWKKVLKKYPYCRPNPTADKLFFFRSVPSQPQPEEKNQSHSTLKTNDSSGNGLNGKSRRKSSISLPSSIPATTVAEVLDITIDNNNELHFDDTHWENYMSNLKPLGLNVLLNTCNHSTQEAYSAFHAHISHELIFNRSDANNSHDLVVPVASRRYGILQLVIPYLAKTCFFN
jgi:hypothetical protein